MKNLLVTTAMTLMLTSTAFADNTNTTLTTYQSEKSNDLYASELIGMRVYSAEKDFDGFEADSTVGNDVVQNWDDIGEVNDVILGRNGEIKAVVLGVGGFIGIGEKDVAVEMQSIKFVNESDDADDYFLVVKTNKEALTNAPSYERMNEGDMTEKEAMTEEKEATETAAADNSNADNRPMLTTPEIEREGYETAMLDQLTADDLTGARLYGANDEDIGEIDQLVVNDSGQIKSAILDIGGFLGLGEHRISVTMDELKILRNQDGDDVRVYINATKEELEAQPEYNG